MEKTEGMNVRDATFGKEKILRMERYHNRRDLLEALLEGDREYTLEEVNNRISAFMGGE